VGSFGGYGTILATGNGGGTWTVQSSGTSQGITSVSCPSATTCFAVGGAGTILGTSNGGGTWTAQSSGSTDYLLGISCPSTTTCFAVGRFGAILGTSNGGGTWTAQFASANSLSGISCPSATTCFAVGGVFSGTSTILATSNGGGTWTTQSSGTTYELGGVSCPSTSTCFATGSSGTILGTSNGGGTWTAQSSGSTNYLSGVTCPSTGACFAVGSSGTIVGTSNGGGTWTAQSSGSANSISGVSCPSTTTCFAVGRFGTILGTSNGGGTWTAQSSGSTIYLSADSCSTISICLAVGSSGTILGTGNGGGTWTAQSSGSTNLLSGVNCPSTTTCFAVGSSGTILSTSNGGATWTAQTSGTSIDLRGVSCPSTNSCFAVGGVFGGNSTILATSNGGGTWTTQSSGPSKNLYAVSCPSITTCFAVGDGGTILSSSNGGGTWTAQTPGTSNFFLLSVSCPSTTTCFAVGSAVCTTSCVGTILGTSNGGGTWTTQPSGIGTELDGVSCPSTTSCFAVNGQAYCGCGSFGGPRGGAILATTNGGGAWTSQASGTTNQLTGISCPSTTTCFAVGDGGTILANGTPTPPTGIQVAAGDTEATLTWAPPLSGGPITSYAVTASPGGATTTVSAVVPAATVTGLTNGTPYTFTVAATNAVGTGPASLPSSAVTPTAVAQGPSVAVLPAMSNLAYGGYLTTAYLENLGASAAHIRVQYFDTTGTAVGFGNSVAGLVAGGTWTLRTDNGHSLASHQPGSAIVYSDQPLAVFVNEFAPGNTSDATSYTAISVPSGTGSTLFAPAIANNAYGGYTTGIGLVNLSVSAVNITVTYRDSSGTVIKTQTLPNVAAGAYQGLYSGDPVLGLSAGFAGTATITSSAGNLAAVVNETGPGNQFSSYDAVPAGSTTLYAPVALNNAFGGFNTGMGIQNTTGTAGTVTISYYDSSGTATTKTFPIVANGYLGVYQGTDIPVAGAYTAKLTSTVAIAAIVNEVAPSSVAAKQSTAYNTFAAGSSSLHLPLVESAGADGWSTGLGIMNTGSTSTAVTVTYYDAASGATIGTPQTLTLQPNAFWGLYQPSGGLPNGTRASAVVSTGTGGQVAVICNESNATSFMSYIGQ
jgi:photosystem II stability/assembly factor-like uncharacterized protein